MKVFIEINLVVSSGTMVSSGTVVFKNTILVYFVRCYCKCFILHIFM